MQLRYFVPFKAQQGADSQYALKEKLLNIDGIAVDTSVNLNKWQVPEEDLDFFVSTLIGAQLRVDHAESAMAVIGKVPEGKRVGNTVAFRAEVGDEAIIEKIIRGYLTHVSVQVDSDDVECSKCKRPTRKEGILIHLCPGAWEIVHKPRVRELSIVASPAYKNTSFQPLGFAAAMNEDQFGAILRSVQGSQLSEDDKNVGSRLKPQEPENKKLDAKMEVKDLSQEQNAQASSSPHNAQIINLGEGEKAPSQVDYGPFMKQLQDLENQIRQASEGAEGDAEIDTLKQRLSKLESDVAKRATKRALSKKISELSKKLSEEGEEGDEGGPQPSGPIDVISKRKGEEAEEGAEAEEAEEAEASSKTRSVVRAAGLGIIAPEELKNGDALKSPDYDWFSKDLLKAHSKLVGMK
jgi:hypothetical protein